MTIFTTLAILALVATIVSLGWGIGSMAHGGEYDARHSNQLMWARLGFQALALVLLLAAVAASML